MKKLPACRLHVPNLLLSFVCPLLFGTLLFSGCTTQLEGNLNEKQANEIMRVLQQSGISASKVSEQTSLKGTSSFKISIPKSQINQALSILQTQGLPKRQQAGINALFMNKSFVPTAIQQQITVISALNEELAKTIETIDGIIEATVHIAFPLERLNTPTSLVQKSSQKAVKNKASVLVHYNANQNKKFSTEQIQDLIAGAITELQPLDVKVVEIAHTQSNSKALKYSKVGPFLVSPNSEASLKTALSLTLIINILLSIVIAWLWKKSR